MKLGRTATSIGAKRNARTRHGSPTLVASCGARARIHGRSRVLLALGIGANALIFTAVDALLLRPLAVSHPEQLFQFGVRISPSHVSYGYQPYLFARFLREHARSFSDVFAAWPIEMAFDAGAGAQSITGEVVSGNYYHALGLTALLGRLTTEQDDRNQAQVAVLSHGFWMRAFGGRKDIIGRVVRLRGAPFTIVGVLPPGYRRYRSRKPG